MTTINSIGTATGASSTVLMGAGVGTVPVFSATTYPNTVSFNNVLYASGSNAVSGLASLAGGVLVTNNFSTPVMMALTTGQVLIGSTGNQPLAVTYPGLNRIINGDMQVWQRSSGGTASFGVGASTTRYTADRWQVSVGANEASTVSQIAGATSGRYYAQIQRNNGQTGTATMYFCTSLTRDMCVGVSGNVVSLTFTYLCGANFSPAGQNFTVQVFTGTGSTDISGLNGAFTGSTAIINQALAASTSATTTTKISSAAGASVTQVAVQFSWVPVGTAGANDWIEFTDVQLEVSPNGTPFQRVPFGEQWTNCQRFYQKSFPYATSPAQNVGVGTGELRGEVTAAATTTNNIFLNNFPMMLATPTVSTFSPAAATSQMYNITAAAACTGTATANVTPNSLQITATGPAGGAVTNTVGVHVTLEADVT